MYSVICNLLEGTKRYGIRGGSTEIADITLDEDEAYRLATLMNRMEVSEIHAMDVVQDWLGAAVG